MFKLFLDNLKMIFRDRGRLGWTLAFPLIFTIVFGFFFGKGNVSTGTIALINQSTTELAQNLEKAMDESKLFEIQKETNLETAKDLMKKNKVVAVVIVPQDFGTILLPASASSNIKIKQAPQAPQFTPAKIKIIDDPGNAQANSIVVGFLDKFLTQTGFAIQKTQPLFTVEEEKTTTKEVNYFDFVLVGLIGMALMNSSVQSVAIGMSKYREDKILKRIVTTPLKTYKFIICEVLSRLVLNLIQISLILAIGVYFFNGHIYGNLLMLYLFGLLGAVLFQLLGFTVASLTKTTAAAEGMAVAVTIPMMFLAGVFFPIDQLPKWLFSIVQYLPLAPLLRMIRAIALESGSPFDNPINIIIVFSWIAVLLIVSTFKFRLSEE